jgi:hypothetical protein
MNKCTIDGLSVPNLTVQSSCSCDHVREKLRRVLLIILIDCRRWSIRKPSDGDLERVRNAVMEDFEFAPARQ